MLIIHICIISITTPSRKILMNIYIHVYIIIHTKHMRWNQKPEARSPVPRSEKCGKNQTILVANK